MQNYLLIDAISELIQLFLLIKVELIVALHFFLYPLSMELMFIISYNNFPQTKTNIIANFNSMHYKMK